MTLSGKTVVVTGAAGFIGSHLVERLVVEGANVRALVHYNALGSVGWLDATGARDYIDIVAGDITDRDSVSNTLRGASVVFHLAALIAIPYSYRAPASYVNTNIKGTLNVVQSSLEAGVDRVVHTSTSEVYGTARYTPIDEKHPLQGQSPYSASKIGADKLVEAFHCSYELPVVTIRPFNTYGPRQSARAVIPTIISQCLNGPQVKLGELHPTRDLNYVDNTVDGFIAAALCEGGAGRTINLGSGAEISIGDLARKIARLMSVDVVIESERERIRPKQSEVGQLLADNTLAGDLLGWSPRVGLDEGLRKTIEWMRENRHRFTDTHYVV